MLSKQTGSGRMQECKNTFEKSRRRDIMDIKFIKREELQEKPDQKKLGFGKYFADYMFTMDYDEGIGWHDATIRPYGQLR